VGAQLGVAEFGGVLGGAGLGVQGLTDIVEGQNRSAGTYPYAFQDPRVVGPDIQGLEKRVVDLIGRVKMPQSK
jgi:hypothetical protein